MKSFSLLGTRPNFSPPTMIGYMDAAGVTGRYVDPRQNKTGFRQSLERSNGQKVVPVFRLRDGGASPAAPVVELAVPRHRAHFVFLASDSRLRKSDSPLKAVDLLKISAYGLPKGITLHRVTFGRYIIRLTLASTAGYSRFEGTPAQLISTFVQLSASKPS